MGGRMRGGFGGGAGMGNMQALMRQAQKMQEDVAKAQEELEEAIITGSASGDMVVVEMTGKKIIKSVKIKPEIVDPEDVEMLEDMIIVAINDATAKVDKMHDEKMGAFGNLGGMF